MKNLDGLGEVWEIIKPIHCVDGYPKGLIGVEFNLDRWRFREDYNRLSNRVKKTVTRVVGSSEEMIEIINGKDIKAYHLTCSAEQKTGKNSALCVHYNEGNTRHSVALPGVEYAK